MPINNTKIGGYQIKSMSRSRSPSSSKSPSRSSKRNDTVKSNRGIPHQFQNPEKLHKIMSLFQ